MASSFDLDKCIAYIDNNLHENINVEALAQLLHLSTRYLEKYLLQNMEFHQKNILKINAGKKFPLFYQILIYH